jgi:quercetin dioxygenase-like cupin family protein
MKAIKMISKSLLVGFILMMSTSLYAQDSMNENSTGSTNMSMNSNKNMNSKVILDNEKVQVMIVEFAPGFEAPMHPDPENVGYVLAGGKMEVTEQGKEPMVVDLNEGEAMYMPAVTHMIKNVGTTTVKLLITTMKSNQMMMKDESSMVK